MDSFSEKKYYEIAYHILNRFLVDEIDSRDLLSLCLDAYNFEIPLERVYDRNYVMRLDQGPTASFKDFAARIMARLMNYFISRDGDHFTILTATSGDTGSAVASAFHGLNNIDVIILFPQKEVTDTQRKQMTTLNGNIQVIALDGKFDDCQRLVKSAFLDPSLRGQNLTSANSINIGRLLPQSVYYFYAWSVLAEKPDDRIIFSVPSGNYGDLMGGIIAREMGLPIEKLIISTNENRGVPDYLNTGSYKTIDPSINCISSAMNVGHPSNLARIIALYGGMMNEKGVILQPADLIAMRRDFYGISVSDSATEDTIDQCFKKYGLLLEPHGAVAWKGMEEYKKNSDNNKSVLSVSLETAHPAKFKDDIYRILGISPAVPASLFELENKSEEFTTLENDYTKLRDFILKK